MFDTFFKKHQTWFYVAFRIVIGLSFMLHGVQKVFGGFGKEAQVLLTWPMWSASSSSSEASPSPLASSRDSQRSSAPC